MIMTHLRILRPLLINIVLFRVGAQYSTISESFRSITSVKCSFVVFNNVKYNIVDVVNGKRRNEEN